MAEYQPGTCNINAEGVAYRRKVGIIATVLAIFVLVVAVLSGGLMFYLLSAVGLMVLFVGVLNTLQANNSFCASHGMGGTQQAKAGSETPEAVTNESFLAKDKQRSKSMMVQAALIALGVVVVAVVISTLV